MRRSMRWCGIVVLVLVVGGCAGQQGGDGGSATPTPTPESGNGALYLGTGSGVLRYPILSDGDLGEPTDFPMEGNVLDGRGDTVLSGVFEDVYSVRLDVRDAASGDVLGSVAKDWCGGEGAEFRSCVLLDPDRLVRTSTLWAGAPGGSVVISSLGDGQDVRSLGEIADLVDLVGTESADAVMLSLADEPMTGGDLEPVIAPSGTVVRLDLTTGSTTDLGAYPEAFTPLCAVGLDSLLGYTSSPAGSEEGSFRLVMVGPATMSPQLSGSAVGVWPTSPPQGCSADGRFAYAPVSAEDSEAGLERVGLADGSRTIVPGIAILPEELFAVTR